MTAARNPLHHLLLLLYLHLLLASGQQLPQGWMLLAAWSAAASIDRIHHVASSASSTEGSPQGNTIAATYSPSHALGRGQRPKHPPNWHKDYVAHAISSPSISSRSSSTPCSLGTPYPLAHFVNCDKFSLRHRVFIAAVDTVVEPRNFKEAKKDEGWREAMQKEISALENNHTWVMEKLPPGKKSLGCRWVYKVKLNSDGFIERLKARLIIFGNHQVVGIDYNDTFAPVAKMVTVRAFLVVATAKNWELHQMVVHDAFLHGDLDEEVYMTPSPSFHGSKPGLVCRLRKSLYGLRQAPRCWFFKLASSLKRYVSGNDSAAITSFKSYLSDCFHMKDLGVLKYFLGIEGHVLSTPIEQNHILAKSESPLISDREMYRRLVGVTRIGLVVLWQDDLFLTKKQDTVAKSSAEAEFRSMSKTTNELKWLKALLLSLGVSYPRAMSLLCDSHLHCILRGIRSFMSDDIISLSYVKTTDQLADIFTQALNKQQFLYLLGKLGICIAIGPLLCYEL
ncbi:uncharacterized protein LOC110712514 [Chenopodium quinoa]|uniref:uncharacterized protein LOC110712514 n=1 Tax=Chenopodium quinoa TaxID=63459 RepID=UPI000B784D5E|nr:uncharacterized protein LOC110712514 [Chenopodium quinoa]